MPHRHWQPDALLGRRTRLLTTNEWGLWVAVDDDASRLLYHSEDGGRNWRLASRGLPAAARITALLTDPTGLLLATRLRGLFHSRDRGVRWHPAGSDQLHDKGLSALASSDDLLFAGTRTSGIWCSADGGHSWQSANDGLPLAGRGLSILAVAPTPAGVVASHPFGVHRSEMPGWIFASTGLPPGAALPWIGSSGDVLVTGGATGIYRSADRGSSWTHVFPSAASQLIITSLTASRNTILAGTMHPSRGSGLYISTDGGTSWGVLCDGLDDDLTPSHVASFPGGVAVGTREHGVWIRTLDDPPTVRKQSLTETRLPLVLRQNTPNPFSTSTTIAYVLLRADKVRLDVRDVAGRDVARLVDVRQNAGDYEVVFDAGELEGGFYTYQLSLDGLSQTRQMLLLR